MVCITLLCVQPIPILCLLFVLSLYSTFIYLSPLFLCSVMIVEGILCIRFVHMCVTDSIVRKCVPVKD